MATKRRRYKVSLVGFDDPPAPSRRLPRVVGRIARPTMQGWTHYRAKSWQIQVAIGMTCVAFLLLTRIFLLLFYV